MKFHYKGKYNSPEELPYHEEVPGAVQFKEVKDLKALSTRANTIAIILLVVTLGLIYLRAGRISFGIGMFAAYVVFLVVHEFLHAVWYKGDVYMFQNLRNGLLFVIGTEDFSKGRFILKSLFPSLVLGVIPFIAFMINPELGGLGTFGALNIASAAGDY